MHEESRDSTSASPAEGQLPSDLLKQVPEILSLEGRNWLRWQMRMEWAGVDQSDQQAVERFVNEAQARDKRVGELLREQHYLATSNPPSAWNPAHSSEADYWTDYAMSAPGLDESRVRAELMRRKVESSAAKTAPD